MMNAIRAEFRKLFSVRSTYVLILLALLVELLLAFYANGVKASNEGLASTTYLSSQPTQAITLLGIFGALIAILLVTHEYRYNTILYTLTAAKSRSTVLFAKVVATTCFSVVFTIIMSLIAVLLVFIGIKIGGGNLAAQSFPLAEMVWKTLLIGWGYAMFGLILAFIIRVQPGVIAALFLIPSTLESILGIVLKNNVAYLPFTALSNVGLNNPEITAGKSAIILLAYVLGGLLVSLILFNKRDAN